MGQDIFHINHLIWDNANNCVHLAKAEWLPNVPATVQNASRLFVDPDTENRVYVRRYNDGTMHMVAINQKRRVITQFPFSGKSGGDSMILEWERDALNKPPENISSAPPTLNMIGSRPAAFHKMKQGIPAGSFCYGYLPKQNLGFASVDGVRKYLIEKYGPDDSESHIAALDEYYDRHYCIYWKPSEHGFVECALLKRKAIWISSDLDYERTFAYFGSEEKLIKEISGFLLGDAIKECNENRYGSDFEYLE